MSYDYIIVGAGPTGLTVAYGLAHAGKRCLVVDRQETIGGCHRVLRVNGFFTEHSPRVYLSSYLNTMKLFRHMNLHDMFTTYQFGIGYIAEQISNRLSWYECGCMAWAFTRFMVDGKYGETITVQNFANDYGFSDESKDFLDRLCRFTDGAGADRYSINQLLQIMNQNACYSILQPKLPNDIAMFPRMQYAMENIGVSFLLHTEVQQINIQNNRVSGLVVHRQSETLTLSCDHLILAVPPKDLLSLLPNVSPFGELSNWVTQTSYNTDLAVIFHWDTKLVLPKRWGFPISEWGLIFINMTDYMSFANANSKTVISTCITYLDTFSRVTGKTANQTSDANELIHEQFRQLCISFPELPTPTFSCISPTIYRDQNQWKSQDSAFIHAANTSFLPSKGTIPNLFQVGIQNGHSPLSSTTFESAVANGLAFLEQEKMPLFKMHYPITLRFIFMWVVIILALILIGYFLWRWFRKIPEPSVIEIPFEMPLESSLLTEIPSEMPEMPSEIPVQIPDIPDIPEMPEIPEIPEMPEIPDISTDLPEITSELPMDTYDPSTQ